MTTLRIAVVGAGIVGLAVARRVLEVEPAAEVTVLEKETRLAAHQTGHNSGVVHAGIYYKPGSLKAELTREGRRELLELCERRNVSVRVCGKVVVALNERELLPLDEVERRSIANAVAIRRVGQAELHEIEPHAAGVAALYSPTTAVVDFVRVAEALATELAERGGTVMLGARVRALRRTPAGSGPEVVVASDAGEVHADRVVVCAGLQSDRLARLAGAPADPAILPFRGEYYRLVPARSQLVHGLIYPVPDERYPFLGVHFTRRIDGTVEVGPNAVLALSREGYRWRDVDRADLMEMVCFPGFWRLAGRHWRTAGHELVGSMVRQAYLRAARRYLPELRSSDVERAGAGVRAQAVGRDGSLLDDFVVQRAGPVVAVRNAPSPAATASLAIARHVVATALAER